MKENNLTKENKIRLIFTAVFVFLVFAEVYIALFVRDDFIRPYFGDVIVVWVIYAFVRIFLKLKPYVLLPVCIFIFSVFVEAGQYFKMVDVIGLGHIEFFRILMGTSFSWIDIICYGAGCALLLAGEVIFFLKIKKHVTLEKDVEKQNEKQS